MKKIDPYTLGQEGKLDEALDLATEQMKQDPKNSQNQKNYYWTLVNLLKSEEVRNSPQKEQLYKEKFHAFGRINFIKGGDPKLLYSISRALMDESTLKKVKQAEQFREEKQYLQAHQLYRDLANEAKNIPAIATSYAWILYHYCQEQIIEKKYDRAKKVLHYYLSSDISTYIKSEGKESSYLGMIAPKIWAHSYMLILAKRMRDHFEAQFDMGVFAKLWDLKYLTTKDFTPDKSENGTEFTSLASKVIRYAAKDAFQKRNKEIAEYLMPYIDKFISKEPNKYWEYSKAKCLLTLENVDEAILYIKEVIKTNSASWAWKYLGDIYLEKDENIAFSCYCKALQDGGDIEYLRKIKIALANLLIKREDFPRAKTEFEEVIKNCHERNDKISEPVKNIIKEPWYETTPALESNRSFYYDNGLAAEAVLYDDIPWQDAFIGDIFENKDNKKKQIIYLITKDCAVKISCSISKIPSHLKAKNTPIKVKCDEDVQGKYRIYMIEARESHDTWENISPCLAVVSYINYEKKIAHLLVDKNINCTLQLSEIDVELKYLDVVEVYLIKEHLYCNAMFIKKSNQQIPEHLTTSFIGRISTSGDVGFVNDVFVPPNLLIEANIEDADSVEGLAIRNYNKKRKMWGWKAYHIVRLEKSD